MILSLLKILTLSSSIELGYIPEHNLALYMIPSEAQRALQVEHTIYADYQGRLNITQYAAITGGLTAFSFPLKNEFGAYPFRMDFNIGGELKYKNLTIGYEHACYHPIAPNEQVLPLPALNSANNRFYIKAVIGEGK